MDILKFTVEKLEITNFLERDPIEIRGSFAVIDSNGVEQPLLFQAWDDNGAPSEVTGPNGEELGYNDLHVNSEDEQAYVLFEYDPTAKRFVPAAAATLRLTDDDYDAMFKALDSIIGKRITDAYDAAEDAFRRVMTDAR